MLDHSNGELIDLAGRIMLSHTLAPEHATRVLRIPRDEADAMIGTGRLSGSLDAEQSERLRLFVNILIRLEHRLQHDSCAIRHTLEAPLDALGGISPADLLDGSLDDLRALRRAIETVEAPKLKWWRVGH